MYCFTMLCSLGWELAGAAYAYCATTGVAFAATAAYLAWRSVTTAGQEGHVSLAPTLAALKGWGPYLGLALPAVIMTCMEGCEYTQHGSTHIRRCQCRHSLRSVRASLDGRSRCLP